MPATGGAGIARGVWGDSVTLRTLWDRRPGWHGASPWPCGQDVTQSFPSGQRFPVTKHGSLSPRLYRGKNVLIRGYLIRAPGGGERAQMATRDQDVADSGAE